MCPFRARAESSEWVERTVGNCPLFQDCLVIHVSLVLQRTWQFMSVALLQNEEHKHKILDDQESLFHVLTWFALHCK